MTEQPMDDPTLIGPIGPPGPPGEDAREPIDGIDGARGEIGPAGTDAPTPIEGSRGPKGDPGIQGPKGDPGPRGRAGGLVDASVSASEGAQWGVSQEVVDGEIRFDFTFPPGGTAWWRGGLTADDDLDILRSSTNSGLYYVLSAADAAGLNLPDDRPGTISVEALGTGSASGTVQTYTARVTNQVWTRSISGGSSASWTDWRTPPTASDLEALVPRSESGTTGRALFAADTPEAARQALQLDDLRASHVAIDTDGVPYFKPGSVSTRVHLDTDGVPYFEPA